MNDKVNRLKLQVEGIVCSGCAMDMENILRDTDGIIDAAVNYADGTILIEFDPDEINERDVFIRVRKLGYPTTILSRT